MRFQSPLRNLCDVLVQIQESANLYKSTLNRNEAATRAVLVDPILRSLGWETANTGMVEVEKPMGQVRADYALLDGNTDTRIIVEAKSLGTNLNQNKLVMDLVNYAFSFGLSDVFLTDGLIWQHFDRFQPGKMEPSKTLNLVSDNAVECAAYFVQHLDAAKYWPVEQTIDVLSQKIEQLESTVTTLQSKLDILIANQNQTSGVEIINKLHRTQEASLENLDFVDLEDLEDSAGKKPSHFRLPDGSVQRITKWKDVLIESCKYVLANNPAIPIPFPDRAGKKVSLFNDVKPAKGISYITEEYKGKTIFIYANYDSNNCVANALYILKQIPKNNLKTAPAIVLESSR